MDPGQVAPGDGLNIIYDDRPRLLDRVSRLNSGLAFSDEPHSATSHTLSPPRLLEGPRAQEAAGGRVLLPGEHAVTARCVIGRARPGRTDTFHARIRWVLRDSGDSRAHRHETHRPAQRAGSAARAHLPAVMTGGRR